MSVTHGAKVDVLDQIAEQLTGNADSVEQIRQHANSTIATLKGAWQGRDMDKFAGEWASSERNVVEAHDRLQTMAKALREQAQQQRTTSGVGSGSAAVPLVPGGPSGGPAGGGSSDDHGGGLLKDLATAWGIKGLISKIAGAFGGIKGISSFYKALAAAGAEVGAIETAYGNLMDTARKSGLLEKLVGTFASAETASRIASIAGKAGLAGTIISGLVSGVTGDGYGGARGLTSRVLGVAGATGAGAMLFAADTALMATGVGAPIAIAAIAAYGAWEAGNYLWDHREAIGNFLSNAGQKIWDFGSSATTAVANVASGAVDAVSNVASGAAHFVSHLVPHVSIF